MVKNILFKIKLKGKGIVNYDSNEQKRILFNYDSKNTNHLRDTNKNVSFAKKNFFLDKNGILNYKIKISSDALRNNIFKEDLVAQTSSFIYHPALLYSYIASPLGILRGYMFAGKDGKTIKRKSPLTITDAEQISSGKSYIETFSRSGEKDIHENKEVSDTSFFKKETIGDIEYQTEGNLNIGDLQFISADSIFDRVCFNPNEYEDYYKKFAEVNISDYNGDIGYYTMKTSIVDIPEYGLLLSDKTVKVLIKEIFKRILKLNIVRTKAYAELYELNIKLVENPLIDTFNNKNNWISINSEDDIEQLINNIQFFKMYEKEDDTKAKEIRQKIEDEYNKKQELAKKSKLKKSKK